MARSIVFTIDGSQAMRLPKAVAFPGAVRRVDILTIGCSRLVVPSGHRWADLFARGPRASEDFMSERSQPAQDQRDS